MADEKKGSQFNLYGMLFGKSWKMWVGAVVLSVLSVVLFVIESPWGSSGGILNWGQNLYDTLGLSLEESAPAGVTGILDHKYAMLSLTMLIGALGAALLAKEFAIRIPPKGEMAKGFLGGVLMAFGCTIGAGCTIGNFYSGWPAMSGGGLVFVLGLFVGVFIAVKYILWEMENHPNLSQGDTKTYLGAKSEGRSLQPIAGLIVLIIGALLALIYDASSEEVLISFVLIGLIIGVVLQRSRFCIVRTLREIFLTGDSEPSRDIIVGLIVGLFCFAIIKYRGIGDEMAMVAANFWVPAIIGGVIFGVGMTIAGGCTVGSTWRAGEGHVKLWLALIGLVLFAPLSSEYVVPLFSADMKERVFLPDTFGYGGAICLVLLIMFIWYLFARWNEKTGRFSAL